MKKIVLLLLCVLVCTTAGAVLKEKDLGRTLAVLRLELQQTYQAQKRNLAAYEERSVQQHANLIATMQQCDQISLMLYSQKRDFTFDVAYACQQATDLYSQNRRTTMPYQQIKERVDSEIARYDSLIHALMQIPPSLGHMRPANAGANKPDSLIMQVMDSLSNVDKSVHPFMLNKEEQADREKCIFYAKALRNNLKRFLEAFEKDKEHYDNVTDKVEKLNSYAIGRYSELQQSIFKDGGNNYFVTLLQLKNWIQRTKSDVNDKYMPFRSVRDTRFSQWRGPVVLFISAFMILYIIVATILSNILLRWVLPKRFRTESFRMRRPVYIMTLAILIFAVVVMVLRMFINTNLVLMATGLMINMAWLMFVIFVSLLIRLKAEEVKHGARVYTPFILMAMIVIIFRIVLIPNNLVNLIYPPVLLGFTIWQYVIMRKSRKNVPVFDKFYCSISLYAMLVSCCLAWAGYTLMAVQIMIWWAFQLTAIQTITCFYDLMAMYERKHLVRRIKEHTMEDVSDESIISRMKKGDFIHITWFYDLVNRVVVPILAVLSIISSIYWAAGVFEMTETCKGVFFTEFAIPTVCRLSLAKICIVAEMFFLFRFIAYAVRAFYYHLKNSLTDGDTDFNKTLVKNVVAIVVWGIFVLAAMILLDVPRKGLATVMAGLSAGMGFASKDLLENFFYGLSLMTGRVRVGDYIECDGITGRVESITYQSTQIVTLDGSVIAFLNSALFNKNFKNLTRNHQYVLVKVPVGVAYGTNINNVRDMLVEGLGSLCTKMSDGRDIINPQHGISVAFAGFGDSSVDLNVMMWILVEQKLSMIAQIQEKVYNILNEHNVEIPFPQQDIHMRND